MIELSPCIEWLYAESGDFPERIRAAAADGMSRVEFWTWSDKDPAALAQAIAECGVSITSMVNEPELNLVDPATHDDYMAGLERTCSTAKLLGVGNIVVLAGRKRPGVDRKEQIAHAVRGLEVACRIAAGHGVRLLLEPLNDRVDHPNSFLNSTLEAWEIIEAVGSPQLGLLFDLYHSQVMGEDLVAVLSSNVDQLWHVQIADAPGRHEPGTGSIPWRRVLSQLLELSYTGPIGLEYQPQAPTSESLAYLREVIDSL